MSCCSLEADDSLDLLRTSAVVPASWWRNRSGTFLSAGRMRQSKVIVWSILEGRRVGVLTCILNLRKVSYCKEALHSDEEDNKVVQNSQRVILGWKMLSGFIGNISYQGVASSPHRWCSIKRS